MKWDAKSTTEANGLLKDIQSSEFLIAFIFVATSFDTQKIFPSSYKEPVKMFYLLMRISLVLFPALMLHEVMEKHDSAQSSRKPMLQVI